MLLMSHVSLPSTEAASQLFLWQQHYSVALLTSATVRICLSAPSRNRGTCPHRVFSPMLLDTLCRFSFPFSLSSASFSSPADDLHVKFGHLPIMGRGLPD